MGARDAGVSSQAGDVSREAGGESSVSRIDYGAGAGVVEGLQAGGGVVERADGSRRSHRAGGIAGIFSGVRVRSRAGSESETGAGSLFVCGEVDRGAAAAGCRGF